MAKRKIINAGLYLKDCLEQRGVRVSKIILFGSQAMGRADKFSDIDFIIVSDDFKGKDIFDRAEMIGDVEFKVVNKYDIPVDLMLKTPEEIEEGGSITTGRAAREGLVVWAA